MSAQRKRLLERDGNGKPTFVYVNWQDTNIRALFDKVRKELAKQAEEVSNVKPISKAKRSA